jgi:hypothetical protein
LDSARLQGFLGNTKQGFTQIAVMVGAGRGLHFQHLITNRIKLQYVSMENIVSNGYIALVNLTHKKEKSCVFSSQVPQVSLVQPLLKS